MELVTLNSDFQPDKPVENYSSLIWTERYSTNGDFQLTSNDIYTTINLLPKESYVSLRDSTVPMIVEQHIIEKPKNQAPVLTVIGRSFESVLERRAAVKTAIGGTKTAWVLNASKESDAAFKAIRTVLGDAAQYQDGLLVLPAVSPAVSSLDAIPEIELILPADYETPAWDSTVTYVEGDLVGYGTTIYVATSASGNLNKNPASQPTYWTSYSTGFSGSWGTQNAYEVGASDLYLSALNLLTANYRGIKSIRPQPDASPVVGIEIYNGADLTDIVSIDARFNQFDSAKYFLTEQGSTNVAYVYGQSGSSKVLKTAAPEPSGLNRRVLLLDVTNDSDTSSEDVRNSRGLIELYNNNAIALFGGEIGINIAIKYNVDYFLGDIVNLVGEYGLYQSARIAEFIRSSDSSGEKSYPTFEAVS